MPRNGKAAVAKRPCFSAWRARVAEARVMIDGEVRLDL
jgi:hypothetical protein